MEFALVARKGQNLDLIMLKVFLGELVVAISNPKSGEKLLDIFFGVGVRFPVSFHQGMEIGKGKP